jgi:4-hydroxyphenylpyruvate dioxygenase
MAYFTDKFKGKKYFKDISFHHIEYYVGNAKQASEYYKNIFGFSDYAYAGPETGLKDRVSYVIRKNKVFYVLTTPLKSDHSISKWLLKHGDGVYNIAFNVDSVEVAYKGCLNRGAESVSDVFTVDDENGSFSQAFIKSYGDCVHSFINNRQYKLWAPNFVDNRNDKKVSKDTKIELIDHIVANVEIDKMDFWKDYYERIFGFSAFVRFDETDISTKYSSLKSVVLRSENWKVKLPINEPAEGLKKSQIEEYLDFNEGPGVQHIALLSSDIIQTIKVLRSNGLKFLKLPDTYYELLKKKNILIKEDILKLQELGILLDSDEEGYLLQLFTQPIQDRPTLFIEIIQRRGSRGFGQGNFQSLFESIELEQSRRGNL